MPLCRREAAAHARPRGAGQQRATAGSNTVRLDAAGSRPRTPRAESRRSSRAAPARRPARAARSTSVSSLDGRRHLQHRATSRRRREHVTAGAQRPSRRSAVEVPAHARSRICARTIAPRASRRGNATCAGVDTDRNVSATISRPSTRRQRRRPDRSTPIHATFTCGRPTDFDSPPSPNASARDCSSTDIARPCPSSAVVGEHLVADQRHAARRAQLNQRLQSPPGERPTRSGCWARRRARPWCAPSTPPPPPRRRCRHSPCMSRSYGTAHALERREVLEERIAGPRHQHGIAGVAQQLEEQRVGFAGAGGERIRDRRHRPRRGARSRPRRPPAPTRIRTARVVGQRGAGRPATPAGRTGRRTPALGRIRLGEIEERPPAARAAGHRRRQPVRREVARQPAPTARSPDAARPPAQRASSRRLRARGRPRPCRARRRRTPCRRGRAGANPRD